MTKSPLQIFNSAHTRALKFVNKGVGAKRRDEQRAAVVFSAAAIDAYFRVKVVNCLLRQFETANNSVKDFSPSAKALLQNTISSRNFDKEYGHLKNTQKRLIDTQIKNMRLDFLITYLQDALEYISFLRLTKMEYGFSLMGISAPQVWNTLKISWKKPKQEKKKKLGRPVSKKRGPKIQAQVQLDGLFTKRHLIVHEADINLRGRKYMGDEKVITYGTVKRWLEYSKKTIHEIDSIIK